MKSKFTHQGLRDLSDLGTLQKRVIPIQPEYHIPQDLPPERLAMTATQVPYKRQYGKDYL